jgi:hypothetical protein
MSNTNTSTSNQSQTQKQKQKKNLINPAERKVSVNISMPLYVLDKIDQYCGDNDRSALVVNILKREFKLS